MGCVDLPDLPDDLVCLQAAWYRAYDALAAPRPARTTALRRRLYALSVRLRWHPYWTRTAAVPAARAELRRQGRQLRTLEGAR
ncbi:hypothetical protein OG864_02500 [Streptomyces sp. NBC_00124]|uniref:hypothetical protein n=1 Tax=Streptomyces sp. NBC_00124 TaxID=2975662 RepID=UPI00224CA22C|nr:hypothetical protein [Streptomyces sp. NBC_00124]MCX5357612.1 hypothetical protein [Streptomyces sp. NBC_00124]